MAHYLTILPLCCLFVNSILFSQEDASAIESPYTIRFFFKPLFQESIFKIPQEALLAYLGSPEKLDRSVIREKMAAKLTSGINVGYAGIITASDFNGEIILPRLHNDDTVTLIIANRTIPTVPHGVTATSWNVLDPKEAAWFLLKRTTDEQAKKTFWNVEEITPKNRVPQYAVIIFNSPHAIILREGIYPAENGPHLILPDMYVSPDINLVQPAARIVPYNRFFAPLRSWTVYTPERTALLVT